jgi:hypothetical protein
MKTLPNLSILFIETRGSLISDVPLLLVISKKIDGRGTKNAILIYFFRLSSRVHGQRAHVLKKVVKKNFIFYKR